MHTHDPGFFTRFWLAFVLFFRILFDSQLAGRALQLRAGTEPSSDSEPPAPPSIPDAELIAPVTPSPMQVEPSTAEAVPVVAQPAPAATPLQTHLHVAPTEAALQLLGLLQREGRLLDFLQEDMGEYTDAQVGAAARVVHDQCKRALDAHLKLERIRGEEEGSQISVPKGYPPGEIRLVGNVAGEPPFTGALTHGGWRVAHIQLPTLSDGHDVHVIAPAEVEL